MKYPFTHIEAKWQNYWEEHKTFHVTEDEQVPKAKRKYILDMFPYPSAQGLHVGHPEGYTATDIYSRYLRMKGYKVLHPMGFDAFGLPAENYAIKTGTHPKSTTEDNIRRFTKQIKALGFSYDWDRVISTCDEEYYKWTQWIFLELYKKGLAYEAMTPINWCPSCLTGLSNEEVKEGKCERCGSIVTKKTIRQWMLRITAYADRLLKDLDTLDWPLSVKLMQKNWIGRSEGALVKFMIADSNGMATDKALEVYTTRCDTLFGATYMVVAPEHPLMELLATSAHKDKVYEYIQQALQKSDLERTDLSHEKTGVFTGSYAINPVNKALLPIWVSDYVLTSYGTGAIMAVPAHDTRDWEFSKKFSLPIIEVLKSKVDVQKEAWVEDGIHVNSDFLDGLNKEAAIAKMLKWLQANGSGKASVQYKLRDWVFSRQRYWGEPIPLVHCPKCGIVPLGAEELPLRLPNVKSYQPTGTGESPLAGIKDWVECKCPKCKGEAKRETNTMPQWAGSCWYYLRYLDPKCTTALASKKAIEYWLPVDLYVGGAEHAVLHLLYARFWHKVLYDLGVVNTIEPFHKLVNQGMITSFAYQRPDKVLVATDKVEESSPGVYIDKDTGVRLERVVAKMSKSLKNVVNPDDMIREYGADSVRMYEMFMGPLTVSKPWNTQGLIGISRFLEKIYALVPKASKEASPSKDIERLYNRTVKKVSEDTENLCFNTSISAMMIFINEVAKLESIPNSIWEGFVKLLAPYAPHLAEELWEHLGHTNTIAYEPWPTWDEGLCNEDSCTIVVMVNGKLRAKFTASPDAKKEDLEATAKLLPAVVKYTKGKDIVKLVVVPGKLVSIVVK